MDTMTGRNVGKTCRTHYRGTFNDGTQFDSSYDQGDPPDAGGSLRNAESERDPHT